MKAEVSRLEELGIVHAIRGQKDLEEAAGAYKDIDEVMANQSDLVNTVRHCLPWPSSRADSIRRHVPDDSEHAGCHFESVCNTEEGQHLG